MARWRFGNCEEALFLVMEKLTLTKQQARKFLLAYQGIWPQSNLEEKFGIVDYIRRVGCIQFDPLNVVGHNHELVLQARIPEFRPVMLQELLYKERKLLDGWDKNMSIYCVEDWPYFRRFRESALQRLGNSSRPAMSILQQVRSDIETQGPLSSIDLDYDQIVDWSWAPTRLARAALESMYFWGDLIIHHKVNTRKVYDFANRHIPKELLSTEEPNETLEQYHDWYVLRRIGSVGLLWNKASDAWLGISGIKSKERNAAVTRLLRQGKVIEVCVEGISPLLYIRNDDRSILKMILHNDTLPPRATIMAPLDNLLWDRRLVKELFDFEYRWEVYKPVTDRQYGYYVLPVLYGDRFIARFEPGRDKINGGLIIKNWWWEPGISQTEEMQIVLLNCFKEFLVYLGTDRINIDSKTLEREDLDWLIIS